MGDEGSAAMKAALAAAGEGPVRPKKKEKEKEEMPWKVSDFQGKYHTHAIKNAYPIPGSMIEYEAKRVAFIAADREARASRLRHIRDGFEDSWTAAMAAARGWSLRSDACQTYSTSSSVCRGRS